MTSTLQASSPSAPSPPATPRPHLNFLDGIRGIAAVWVMLSHLETLLLAGQAQPVAVFPFNWILTLGSYGGFAVTIFITLSGFCLMLPIANEVARGRSISLTPAWWRSYLYRRARRILPPYYATLALCWLLPVMLRLLPGMRSFGSDTAAMNYGTGNVLSHLFLVHNLSPKWWNLLDPPMWSVATEWQIYFLFPLFLLPAWRYGGRWAAVGVGFLIGFLPQITGFYPVAFDTARSFYLGVFALGMAGADLRFCNPARWERIQARTPWTVMLAIVTLLLIATMVFFNNASPTNGLAAYSGIIGHIEAAVVTLVLILFCARSREQTGSSLIRHCLESRVAIKLGTFSYSLYLIHYPVLDFFVKHLHGNTASPLVKVVVVIPACIAAALMASYIFHLLVERHFMSAASRPRAIPAPSAAASSDA